MESMNCSTCDTQNSADARFCTHCGAVIPPLSQPVLAERRVESPHLQTQYPLQQNGYQSQPVAYNPPQHPAPHGHHVPQPYAPQDQNPQQLYVPHAQPQQINVVVHTQVSASTTSGVVTVIKPKSVILALVLTFLFGPFGLFYVTIRGAIIFLLLTIVLTIVTAGAFGFLAWMISIVWSGFAALNYNKQVGIAR